MEVAATTLAPTASRTSTTMHSHAQNASSTSPNDPSALIQPWDPNDYLSNPPPDYANANSLLEVMTGIPKDKQPPQPHHGQPPALPTPNPSNGNLSNGRPGPHPNNGQQRTPHVHPPQCRTGRNNNNNGQNTTGQNNTGQRLGYLGKNPRNPRYQNLQGNQTPGANPPNSRGTYNNPGYPANQGNNNNNNPNQSR